MEQPEPVQASSAADRDRRDEPPVVPAYSLGSSGAESARLQRQTEELAPLSTALLDKVHLSPGDRVLDCGCGPRGIIELLSERVSPGGRVVGLDADAAHVTMAQQLVADRGLTDVEVLVGDARHTGLAAGSFDLVHARMLLVNVPAPEDIVIEMVRLARPGGWVVGMEPDVPAQFCYPPHPDYDRLCELFPVVAAHNGADWMIGRRLAELYRQAGLEDVRVQVRAELYPVGHSRRTIRLDLVRSMRSKILDLGLASADDLDGWDTAARVHLDDPRTLVMPNLNFLAWGTAPVHG
jgi:SAM-dependent methyltransferase